MAAIVIIDSSRIRDLGLAEALRKRGHHVTVRSSVQWIVAYQAAITDFDLVVADFTCDSEDQWEAFGQLCRRHLSSPAPAVLALSALYRGPHPRLRAERRGLRWLYVV